MVEIVLTCEWKICSIWWAVSIDLQYWLVDLQVPTLWWYSCQAPQITHTIFKNRCLQIMKVLRLIQMDTFDHFFNNFRLISLKSIVQLILSQPKFVLFQNLSFQQLHFIMQGRQLTLYCWLFRYLNPLFQNGRNACCFFLLFYFFDFRL